MDYEQLLQKYMAQVVSCEGVTFMELIDSDSPEFSEEEREVLRRIENEVRG